MIAIDFPLKQGQDAKCGVYCLVAVAEALNSLPATKTIPLTYQNKTQYIYPKSHAVTLDEYREVCITKIYDLCAITQFQKYTTPGGLKSIGKQLCTNHEVEAYGTGEIAKLITEEFQKKQTTIDSIVASIGTVKQADTLHTPKKDQAIMYALYRGPSKIGQNKKTRSLIETPLHWVAVGGDDCPYDPAPQTPNPKFQAGKNGHWGMPPTPEEQWSDTGYYGTGIWITFSPREAGTSKGREQ